MGVPLIPAKTLWVEFDFERHMAVFKARAPVTMASKAECMIQEAGGHEGFLSVGRLGGLPTWKPDCPLLFNP
jgi:hypothetical protein